MESDIVGTCGRWSLESVHTDRVLAPFWEMTLTWKSARIRLEESFSCQKIGCPCGGDRCLVELIPLRRGHHPVPRRLLYPFPGGYRVPLD